MSGRLGPAVLGLMALLAACQVPHSEVVAEYEPSQGVLVTYEGRFVVPAEFLREVIRRGDLYCLVGSHQEELKAEAELSEAGISGGQVSYIVAPFDSPWVRDYGPVFVRREAGPTAVGFRYNRKRPRDQRIAAALARFLGVNYEETPLVLTGGNQFFGAEERAFASDLIDDENGQDRVRLETLLGKSFGVSRLVTFPDPLHNYHRHANCWMKLLGPKSVALMGVPRTHRDFSALEQIAKTLTDEGYRVSRIPCPGNQPYLNSVLFGGAVFVPIVGQSGNDTAALDAYRAAAPDWEVIGVYSATWLSTDALGCRVLPIPDLRWMRDSLRG